MSWHGTSGGYTNHRCRCPDCKEAWAVAYRAYMNRHPEQRIKMRRRVAAWREAHPDRVKGYAIARRERALEERRAASVERIAAALRSWGMSAAKAQEAAPFVLRAAVGEG
jgi:hypothetical protein